MKFNGNIIISVILCMAGYLAVWSQTCDNKFPLEAMERWDEVYDWLEAPPEGADTTSMTGLLSFWIPAGTWRSALGNFIVEMKTIPIAFSADSVYIKMLTFDSWYEFIDPITGVDRADTITHGWIKGVKEGNSLRFSNKKILAFSEYSTEHYHVDWKRHTLYNQKDTLYVNAVKLAKDTLIRGESEGFPTYCRSWDIEYIDDPVRVDYDPTTHFIAHPNNTILVSTHHNDVVSNRDMHAEMAIKDLVISKITDQIPDSLPAPVVKYREHDVYGYIECDSYLDIFTEDGEMLDCDNIYTVYYVTGEERYEGAGDFIITLKSTSGMNPFKSYPSYNYIGYYRSIDSMEVMCYYEKEDGTRIESPRVKAVDVTGVKDVMADRVVPNIVGDGKVYDLTGREVNPDRLSPGIYIRNGRKFTVTRQ